MVPMPLHVSASNITYRQVNIIVKTLVLYIAISRLLGKLIVLLYHLLKYSYQALAGMIL